MMKQQQDIHKTLPQQMKLADINYEPLKAMNTAWSKVMRDTFKLPPEITVCIMAGLVLYALFKLWYFFPFVLLVPILPISFIFRKVINQKNNVWRDFAAANDWQLVYIPNANISLVPPTLVGVGRNQGTSDVVHAQFEGHQCDIFMYQFTEGGGKSTVTHFYTIARVVLSRPLPHLILDSKKTLALRNKGDAKYKTKLEGDFDEHFSLYHDKDQHIDALSIITPDAMHTLIDSNTTQDIEIIGNNLYFMVAKDIRSPEGVPALFASIDELADEIAHKAKTIRYSHPAQ